MKQEPELIDLFAMFAMVAERITRPATMDSRIAKNAYELAQAMMQEREKYIKEE